MDRDVHAHAQKIDVRGLAAHRVMLHILDQDVARRAAVYGHLDHLGGMGELVAEDARVDREVLGLLAAAIDDAGNETVTAEAARRARALRITGGQSEG